MALLSLTTNTQIFKHLHGDGPTNNRSCDTERPGLTNLCNSFVDLSTWLHGELLVLRRNIQKWDKSFSVSTTQSIWCVIFRAVNAGLPAVWTVRALVYQAMFSWRKQTASVCPEIGAAAAHLPAARSFSSVNKCRSFVATNRQVRGVGVLISAPI